jgi:lipoprotein-anchoring transpeptidase ErfK/SrfK
LADVDSDFAVGEELTFLHWLKEFGTQTMMKAVTTFCASAIVAALVSGCAQISGRPGSTSTTAAPDTDVAEAQPLYQWDGDGRAISRIEIDAYAQRAEFYDGPERIGWAHVATGVNHFETPQGTFRITEKVADKYSNAYGKIYDAEGELAIINAKRGVHRIPPGGRFEGASMPYFMRLTSSGVGMHGGPIPAPGTPASHGCIRLPEDLAPVVFDHVRVGTPVKVFGRADVSPLGRSPKTDRAEDTPAG